VPSLKQVAFVIPNNRPLTPEELQAWNFLAKEQGMRARRLTLDQVARKPSVLASYDVVWWHCDGEYPDHTEINAPLVEAVKKYISDGGSCLFSLVASQFVVDLGLETIRPNMLMRGRWSEQSWADEYPDIRGFGGFNNHHPVFDGFFGGAYTWTPTVGDPYTACYYDDVLPDSGKVVAVEKLYIKLNEQRRIISEYGLGTGRILTIGAHFYFADITQRFRSHLERLAQNCLIYLGEKPDAHKKSNESPYWNFETRNVAPFHHSNKPLGRIRTSLPSISSSLEIHRYVSSSVEQDQFFDLSGRRLLVMGKEREGIAEVWSYPTRLFKNIRTGFKVGDGEWHWLSDLDSTISVRPESLTRRYECDNAVIEEVMFAALTSPAGILHYEVDSNQQIQIVITAQTDLRLMWPLSEQTTGSLRYAWDPRLHSALVTNGKGSSTAILGSSFSPAEHLIGQFSDIDIRDNRLIGLPTNEIQVCSAMRVTLPPKTRRCAFVLAGSGVSMKEALLSYHSAAKNIAKLFAEQVRHYKRLLSSKLRLVTPDEEFNKSYCWSIVATDKLFAETPGLGSSFLAGYGLSSSGWDGGQKVSGRPGYAWYFGRDSAWTCMAALDYGDFEKVRSVLEFLGRHQDINGKILHELTASGHAHFDAADSTPLYLVVFGRYLRASGDIAFVRQQFQTIKKALAYCFSTDTDGDHLIENTVAGHGWIEGGKLFPAHAEHYLASCWTQALAEAAHLAESVRDHRMAAHCKRESNTVRSLLKTSFRNDETGYYSFARNRDGSYRPEKTVLPVVGMYFGTTDNDYSQRSLSEYASDKFTADWGVRIVGKDDVLFDPAGYHDGSIWPLFTGWTSLAEFRLHRPLQGYGHLLSNVLLFDQFAAGYVEEVFHGLRFQPAGVCPHQAWSGAMILQPALEGMLGLSTNALTRSIELRPYLPPRWKKLELRNIHVADQRVTMKVKRKLGESTFSFSISSPHKSKQSSAVQLNLQPMFPLGTLIQEIWIDGKRSSWDKIIDKHESAPKVRALLKSRLQIRFKHMNGVSVVPPRPHFVTGGESKGLRIVNELWQQGAYVMTVEGLAHTEYLLDVFDPCSTVNHIDGGVALARDEEFLTVSVVFPAHAVTGYARKEIRLST
jgi:glycogen debranching enzyme